MQDAHVEPVQSLTSRRGGDRRTILAAGVPIAMLIAVVAGGVLGGPPARTTPATDQPAAVETAPTDQEHVGQRFPMEAYGLPVWTVQETLDQIRAGRMSRGVVAVSGWLTVPRPGGACETAGYAYCRQETVLAGSADAAPTIGDGGDAMRLPRATPALRTIALPGAALRVLGSDAPGDGDVARVPSVLIGSIADALLPDCRASGRRCEDTVTLERVVWAHDSWVDRTAVLVTDGVQDAEGGSGTRHDWIRDVVPNAGETLSEVLVPIGGLHALDPAVDAAVPLSVVGPVWYVRFLVHGFRPRAGEAHDVGWAVIHDASGTVVAAYPGRTAGEVSAPPRPPVRDRGRWPVM